MAEYKGPKIERGSHREEGVGPNKVFRAPKPEKLVSESEVEQAKQQDDMNRGDYLRNALTISNAALKARQLLRIGPALGGFARALMIRGY